MMKNSPVIIIRKQWKMEYSRETKLKVFFVSKENITILMLIKEYFYYHPSIKSNKN